MKLYRVLAPLFFALSGCVSQHDVSSLHHYHHPLPVHPSQSQLIAAAKQHPSASTMIHQPKHITFPRVVSRLQDLGYLPLTRAYLHTERNGHFMRIRHDFFLWPVPAPLQATVDRYAWNAANPFIRSAIIQFERENHLLHPVGVSYGRLHASVVTALFSRRAIPNHYPFKWVYVTKAAHTNQPEQLHVWQQGFSTVPSRFADIAKGTPIHSQWVWGTLVNTGVLGSTPDGTFPVYQRLPVTTMRGTFPVPVSWSVYRHLKDRTVPQWSGSALRQPARGVINDHPVRWQPYSDPGILWVNYFDAGRGLHYYPRASYGFPQSAGCVEQPLHSAKVTYSILNYGDPVTISSRVFPSSPFTIS